MERVPNDSTSGLPQGPRQERFGRVVLFSYQVSTGRTRENFTQRVVRNRPYVVPFSLVVLW